MDPESGAMGADRVQMECNRIRAEMMSLEDEETRLDFEYEALLTTTAELEQESAQRATSIRRMEVQLSAQVADMEGLSATQRRLRWAGAVVAGRARDLEKDRLRVVFKEKELGNKATAAVAAAEAAVEARKAARAGQPWVVERDRLADAQREEELKLIKTQTTLAHIQGEITTIDRKKTRESNMTDVQFVVQLADSMLKARQLRTLWDQTEDEITELRRNPPPPKLNESMDSQGPDEINASESMDADGKAPLPVNKDKKARAQWERHSQQSSQTSVKTPNSPAPAKETRELSREESFDMLSVSQSEPLVFPGSPPTRGPVLGPVEKPVEAWAQKATAQADVPPDPDRPTSPVNCHTPSPVEHQAPPLQTPKTPFIRGRALPPADFDSSLDEDDLLDRSQPENMSSQEGSNASGDDESAADSAADGFGPNDAATRKVCFTSPVVSQLREFASSPTNSFRVPNEFRPVKTSTQTDASEEPNSQHSSVRSGSSQGSHRSQSQNLGDGDRLERSDVSQDSELSGDEEGSQERVDPFDDSKDYTRASQEAREDDEAAMEEDRRSEEAEDSPPTGNLQGGEFLRGLGISMDLSADVPANRAPPPVLCQEDGNRGWLQGFGGDTDDGGGASFDMNAFFNQSTGGNEDEAPAAVPQNNRESDTNLLRSLGLEDLLDDCM